jgi:hypothetical protein
LTRLPLEPTDAVELRRVNQNPYIEEEQKTHWPKEKNVSERGDMSIRRLLFQ